MQVRQKRPKIYNKSRKFENKKNAKFKDVMYIEPKVFEI